MARLVLVHWNPEEAKERMERLRTFGHRAENFTGGGGDGLRRYREDPPDAFVIDLSRLPSHGRELATFLRQQKATREVPLVFVEGADDKVARVRAVLPDATFTTWGKLKTTLDRALKARTAPRKLVVPNAMAAYSGTPLVKKLGIKPASRVVLLGAPDEFETVLGEDGGAFHIRRSARSQGDVVMFFVRSWGDFAKRFSAAKACMADGARMWVAWPKKASGVKSDISEPFVRQAGLDDGLVDFKICSIDETWSGLCFAVRKRR